MNLRTITLSALVLCGLAACDGDDNNTDGGAITVDVVRPDVQTADAQTADAQTADAQTPDVPSTDAPTADVVRADAASDASLDAATDASTDVGGMYVDGCYVGTPVTMGDFLNRCTTAVAFPARAARGARLLADGGVQPLPM